MTGAKKLFDFNRRSRRTNRPGFTLIELLIVAAIFSLTSLIATTVFSNVQTTQRTVQGQQRVTTDGRYVLETMARGIRTGSLNYQLWPNSVAPSTTTTIPTSISVVDQDGIFTCYKKNGSTIEVLSPATSACGIPVGSAWTAITPPDLTVEQLNFFITPTSNPFRAAPRQSSDCKTNPPRTTPPDGAIAAGYDVSVGACICETSADCFSASCTDTDSNATTKSICTDPNIQPQVTIALTTSSTQGSATSTRTSLQTTVVSRVYQR